MKDLQIEEFRVFVNKVLPTVYNDALTYSELLNKVLLHLNKTIDQVNLLSQNMAIGLNQISEIEASGITSIQAGLDEIETAIATIYDKVSQSQLNEVLVQLGEKASISTTYTKTEVDTKDNLKANKAQEPWITPTLLTGATQYGSALFQYRKNTLGELILRGAINVPTINLTIVFILPLNYRPEQFVRFYIDGAFIEVNSSGIVSVKQSSVKAFIPFDGQSFSIV